MLSLNVQVLSAISLCLSGVVCAPLHRSEYIAADNIFGNFSSDKLITFMQTFGYLQEPKISDEGLQAEFLYAEDAVRQGIKNIQKFGGLDSTGILDDKTVKLLSAPRCGVKDVLNSEERRKRYIIGSKNWGKRMITYFIANWSYKVPEEKMVKWVEQSFHAWAQYSRLKFKRVFDSSADIIIAFGSYYHGDRYPFDGPGNILAHAFYPYEENAFGGDVHFDNDENWLENATTLNEGVDFRTVLIHELGHSLGLAHSFVYSSLMFPYYKGLVPPQLDYDDILAMYQLYISRPLQENGDDEVTQKISSDSDEVTSQHELTTMSIKTEQEVTFDVSEEEEENESNESEAVPDLCEGKFDAVTFLKGNIYVFKGDFIWEFDKSFNLNDDFPVKIGKFFPNLPERFKKIDAVHQIPGEDETVLFSGGEYITYDSRGPIYMAYNITRYTYDPDIERIDAAMIWSKNNKTYLFSADRFWKYSDSRQMAPFYPRIMTRWNGIPENLDAAISIPDGSTIFFKGDKYWIYDDRNVRPVSGFPKSTSDLFEYCNV